jgi:single-stranded DNA-binding protein
MNVAVLAGKIHGEINRITTKTGLEMALFTLETTFEDSETGLKKDDYHPVVCFGKNANFLLNHAKTGSMISVEGRIETKVKYQVSASKVQFI